MFVRDSPDLLNVNVAGVSPWEVGLHVSDLDLHGCRRPRYLNAHWSCHRLVWVKTAPFQPVCSKCSSGLQWRRKCWCCRPLSFVDFRWHGSDVVQLALLNEAAHVVKVVVSPLRSPVMMHGCFLMLLASSSTDLIISFACAAAFFVRFCVGLVQAWKMSCVMGLFVTCWITYFLRRR